MSKTNIFWLLFSWNYPTWVLQWSNPEKSRFYSRLCFDAPESEEGSHKTWNLKTLHYNADNSSHYLTLSQDVIKSTHWWFKTRAQRSHWSDTCDRSLPLQVGGWGQEVKCILGSLPKEAASPQFPPRPDCHNHPQTHIHALKQKQTYAHWNVISQSAGLKDTDITLIASQSQTTHSWFSILCISSLIWLADELQCSSSLTTPPSLSEPLTGLSQSLPFKDRGVCFRWQFRGDWLFGTCMGNIQDSDQQHQHLQHKPSQ